jgi:hypothetical protein
VTATGSERERVGIRVNIDNFNRMIAPCISGSARVVTSIAGRSCTSASVRVAAFARHGASLLVPCTSSRRHGSSIIHEQLHLSTLQPVRAVVSDTAAGPSFEEWLAQRRSALEIFESSGFSTEQYLAVMQSAYKAEDYITDEVTALFQDVSALQARLSGLQGVLHSYRPARVPQDDWLPSTVARDPHLIFSDPATIGAQLQDLCWILGHASQPAEFGALLLKAHKLARKPPAQVAENVAVLSKNLSEKTMQKLVRVCPKLLGYSVDTVTARLDQISTMLSGSDSRERVDGCIRRWPGILLVANLEQRISCGRLARAGVTSPIRLPATSSGISCLACMSAARVTLLEQK